MVSVKGTAKGPGVIVDGEKLQVAFEGNELCRHDSVIGYFGLPVFLFNSIAKVALPPGDVV